MESLREQKLQRLGVLKRDFELWKPHLMDIGEQMLPRRVRWNTKEPEGGRINDTIINNAPIIYQGIQSAGLMSGCTSAARRWFRYTTPDPELAEYGSVRAWLHVVEERARWAISRSNIYQALADGIYPDLGGFGFACAILDSDESTIIRANVLPVGEYYLANDEKGQVDTIYRQLPLKVRQLVKMFGLAACSTTVQQMFNKREYDQAVEVVHAVEPNEEYEHGRGDAKGKRWSSCWFEMGTDTTKDKFLRKAGYWEFPGLCPRWSVKGSETYGRGPGMEMLGDCKALQHLEEKLAGLVDASVEPPMKASDGMNGRRASLVPADITYMPRETGAIFEPAVQVQPGAITALESHIARHERRIARACKADLWQRIIEDERQQRATATEIAELRQEKMQQLGPVLERLNTELLQPMTDRVFNELMRRGFLPPPPPELEGVELRVEFESTMHQAQKSVGLGAVRILVGEVIALAEVKPEALDKLNADEIVDEIASMAGTKPDLVLTDEQVAKIRAERAKKQAAEKQGAAALAAADGAAKLAGAPAPSEENALGAIMQQFGGIAQDAGGGGGVA